MQKTPKAKRPLIPLFFISWIPPLISMAFIAYVSGQSLFAYWPDFSDDVIANHQIRTFATYGFSGGYYTVDEQPAKDIFGRFGLHGPVYPVIYGSLLAPFNAPVSGPVWLHHILLALSLFTSFLILRLHEIKKAIAISFLIGTFWPTLSMLSTSMQEGLHATFAILIAATATLIAKQQTIRNIAFGIMMPAVLLRPTWGLMLLAVSTRPSSIVGLILRIISIGFATGGAFLLFRYVAAPSPAGIIERLPTPSAPHALGFVEIHLELMTAAQA